MNAVTIQPVGALTRYDQMCTAIAECIRVDEAKDIRDKALALEAYYRQARNLDAEREAANVRLRAERRVGELLKDLARADAGAARNPNGRAGKEPMSGDRTQVPSPYAAALQDHGMSRQAAHRFQALADIPEAEFDHALRGSFEDGSAMRWCVTETGESVYRSAIARAAAKGELVVVQTDMFGEPSQYGAPC